MHYIDHTIITPALLLTGSIACPSPRETAWATGIDATKGMERVVTSLHRVYRCHTAVNPSTVSPELDSAHWSEIRPSDDMLPFGPWTPSDGIPLYSAKAVELTSADIVYRLGPLRFCNSLALFGLRGTEVLVQEYDAVGGTLVRERTYSLRRPSTGYWDLIHGKRRFLIRLLITDLAMNSAGEVRITIKAGSGELRRVSQIEIGSLQQVHGLEFGGTEYGATITSRVYMYQRTEADGSQAMRLLSKTADLEGRVAFSKDHANQAIDTFLELVGQGVVVFPSLDQSYSGYMAFGILTAAPVSADNPSVATCSVTLRGVPVD